MRLIADVWVPGIPVTKGSVNVNRGGRGVRPAAAGYAAWSRAVQRALYKHRVERTTFGWCPIGQREAAMIRCRFWVPRPDCADAYGGLWFPQARDGDKLERCVWDAVTKAGLWQDDAQVIEWAGSRRWASDVRSPGAHIVIYALSTPEVVGDFGPEVQSGDAYRRAMFGGAT